MGKNDLWIALPAALLGLQLVTTDGMLKPLKTHTRNESSLAWPGWQRICKLLAAMGK